MSCRMVYELHNNQHNLERICAFITDNEYLLPDPLSKHVDIRLYCQKLLNWGRVFVYEQNAQIYGLIMGYMNDIESRMAHLQVLIVASAEQHKGIGKELVQMFIIESVNSHMNDIILTCDANNYKAQLFYTTMGFNLSNISHPNPLKQYWIRSL